MRWLLRQDSNSLGSPPPPAPPIPGERTHGPAHPAATATTHHITVWIQAQGSLASLARATLVGVGCLSGLEDVWPVSSRGALRLSAYLSLDLVDVFLDVAGLGEQAARVP